MQIKIKRARPKIISMFIPVHIFLNGNKMGKMRRNQTITLSTDQEANKLKFRCRGYGDKPAEKKLHIVEPTFIIVRFHEKLEKLFLLGVISPLLIMLDYFILKMEDSWFTRLLAIMPVFVSVIILKALSRIPSEEYFDLEVKSLQDEQKDYIVRNTWGNK